MTGAEHVEELVGVYALDALAPEERSAVEAHLRVCPRCRALAQEAQSVAALLPRSVEPQTPSAQCKQGLMARVHEDLAAQAQPHLTGPAAPRSRAPAYAPAPTFAERLTAWLRPAAPGLAFAGVMAVLVLAVWGWMLQREMAALRTQLQEQQAISALLASPNVQAMPLKATQPASSAQARMMADPAQNTAWLTVSGLEPLPAGRVYEFWLIRDKTPVPAGTFTVTAAGTGQMIVHANAPIRSYQVGAITVEPLGGSDLPTTAPILAGEF